MCVLSADKSSSNFFKLPHIYIGQTIIYTVYKKILITWTQIHTAIQCRDCNYFVRCAEAQEASDRADVEDGPGDPRREGAGEAKQGLPHLVPSILPEPH